MVRCVTQRLWGVDVYLFPVDQVDEAQLALLGEDERERFSRIIVEPKRIQRLMARAGLRRILARELGCGPSELSFGEEEHGRPTLAGDAAGAQLTFNLSHSAHLAAVAISRCGLPLGVDIERYASATGSGIRDLEALARRSFSGPEFEIFVATPERQKEELFYRLWCRKEAYLKAWGTGLSFGSSRFVVTTEKGAGSLLSSEMPGEIDGLPEPEDAPVRWRFLDLPVPGSFAGSLCFRGEAQDVRVRGSVG